MIENPFKGGRNHNAPYKTTHIRIPTDIKNSVSRVIEVYKIACIDDRILARIEFVESLHKFIKGWKSDYGVLANSNKLVSLEEYDFLIKEIKRLSLETSLTNASSQQRGGNIPAALEILKAALHKKANAGGAIKEEIRKAIDFLI